MQTSKSPRASAKTSPDVLRVEVQKHWTDWLKPIATVAGFLLLAAVLLDPMGGFTVPDAPIEVTFDEWFVERDPVLDEEGVSLVGLIDLSGVIVSRDVAESELPDQAAITPDDVRQQLANFHPDDGFKAVVLRITTPGGMVSASDDIAHIVSEYRKVLPVYVYANDLLASGGYYVAAAAEKIYAHKLATVGSIGVIYEIPNIETLAKEKLGVDLEVYKTGPFKDLNNPFRQRTAEERRMIALELQENLDEFTRVVEEGRGLTAVAVKKLATGQVWSGQQAAELQLVDKAIYDDQLAAELRLQLGTDREIAYIRYDKPKSLFDEVFEAAGVLAGRSPTEAVDRFIQPARAGSYYLYYR